MNYSLKITLKDEKHINENLEKLGIKKGKKELIDFFIESNKIIEKAKIYNDVMLSVNEVLKIIEDYKKYKEPFIVEHDLPLFFENSELITEVLFVKKTEESNEVFMVKANEVKDVEDKEIGELVLTVKIDIKAENKFFISPEVNMITYELSDDESLMEDVDVSDEELEAQLDAESDNLEEYADDDDEEEEDFDPELANDSILKDLMTNIIVSKIYAGGYEYPNEKTLEEFAEQLVNMINDYIENNLYKINYNAKEISATEEDETAVKLQLSPQPQPIDDRYSFVQLKNDVGVEMFESKKKCYVITGVNDKRQTTSMVFFESKMEDAIEAFKKSIVEMYPEKSLSSWQIKETLILDPREIFGEEYGNDGNED